MKMINGELNSLVALTTGKLKIEGDLTKAKALKELFKK
jgi:putative sterol carrier protein